MFVRPQEHTMYFGYDGEQTLHAMQKKTKNILASTGKIQRRPL